MIAISSFRPHQEDGEYATNQIRARRSWSDCFNEVHYFGHYEPSLEDTPHLTLFHPTDNWPKISLLTSYASQLGADYVAILNADLVLLPRIKTIEQVMVKRGIPAATSYRYEFDSNDPSSISGAVRHKQDRGMDIFIATPQIWGLVSANVPPYLRIGHQTWDTWVCGFFCSRLGYGFQQFTDERVVFHPKHDGRKTPHSHEIRNDSPYFTTAHVPSPMTI